MGLADTGVLLMPGQFGNKLGIHAVREPMCWFLGTVVTVAREQWNRGTNGQCLTNGTISLWEQLLGNRWTVFVGNSRTHVTVEQMANVCVTNGTIRNKGQSGTQVTIEQMGNVDGTKCNRGTNGHCLCDKWDNQIVGTIGQLLGDRWTVFVGNNGTHVTVERMANVCVTNGTIRNNQEHKLLSDKCQC